MHGQDRSRVAAGNERRVAAARNAGTVNARIRALAARQKALVTRDQLLALGLTAWAIDARVQNGELTVVHRGVYLLGPVMPPGATELAAVLACGRPSFVSHHSAAHLFHLLPAPGAVDVTIVGRRLDSRRGIVVHRTATLPSDEVLLLDGIPITTPARAILDLAPSLAADSLEQLVAEACATRRATRRRLDVLLRRYPRRRGTGVLRELLERPNGPAFTRSRAERMLLELLRKAELPAPQVNADLLGYEVDLLWEEFKLVAEFDSQAFHAAKPKRERDSRRDQVLIRHGYAVLRITWEQLTRGSHALVARIATTMGGRGAELAAG